VTAESAHRLSYEKSNRPLKRARNAAPGRGIQAG